MDRIDKAMIKICLNGHYNDGTELKITSPNLYSALESVFKEIDQHTVKLLEALDFYANKDNYVPTGPNTPEDILLRPLGLAKTNCYPEVKKDEGFIASQALKQWRAEV